MALEDFTTYSDVVDTWLTINSNDIESANSGQNADAYVMDDKGADHFGASFEHTLATKNLDTNAYRQTGCWAVSNTVDDAQYWFVNDSQAAVADWRYATDLRLRLRESEADDSDQSADALSNNTLYYLKVTRTSETSLQVEIYSDATRETLVDTLSITITDGRRYRYVAGFVNYNTGHFSANDIYVENLDLQEAAGPTIPVLADHYNRTRAA